MINECNHTCKAKALRSLSSPPFHLSSSLTVSVAISGHNRCPIQWLVVYGATFPSSFFFKKTVFFYPIFTIKDKNDNQTYTIIGQNNRPKRQPTPESSEKNKVQTKFNTWPGISRMQRTIYSQLNLSPAHCSTQFSIQLYLTRINIHIDYLVFSF